MFCMCYVVFRECARATQVVDLASAELYMYQCTWKQLGVNCGGWICTWSYTEELYWSDTYMYLEPYLEAAKCELWCYIRQWRL